MDSGILVLRVTLDQAEPAVRRKFAEPENCASWALHCVIQDTMGWADRDFDPEAFDLARVEFRDPEKYCRQTFSPRRKRG